MNDAKRFLVRRARRAAGLLAGLVLAAGVACSRAPAPAWQMSAAAREPLARWGSMVAVVDGRLYVAGGWCTRDLRVSTRFDVYDPQADRWRRLPDIPDSLSHLIPAVVGHRIWYAGGYSGCKATYHVVSDVWTYDVDDSTWRPGPSLPEARGGGAFALLDDTLHYVGGFVLGSHMPSARHWVLDPRRDSEWTERAPLPRARGHVGVAVVAGRLYVLGGQSEHDEHDVPWCTVYDPTTDHWRSIADLPSPRSHIEPATVVEDGRIVVMGGCDNTGWRARRDLRGRHWREFSFAMLVHALSVRTSDRYAMSDVTEYDIARDRWRALPALPEPLLEPTAALLGGRVYVTGGSRGGWLDPQSTTRVGLLPPPAPSAR